MSSTPSRPHINGFPRVLNGLGGSARRTASMTRDASGGSVLGAASVAEDEEREEDPIHAALKARWEDSQARIDVLFGGDAARRRASRKPVDAGHSEPTAEEIAKTTVPLKKAARQIDDDYGDDDEDDEEEDVDKDSPLKVKGLASLSNGLSPHGVRVPPVPIKPGLPSKLPDQGKTSEDVRKQLEEDKKAAAEKARQTFQAMFFTLENDRDAMLEQQKLDELDREVENDISGGPNAQPNTDATSGSTATAGAAQGSLGSADLGASSLTLKHLIARIDAKRNMVKASDNQLRTLISEVRKGRSKWASEDRVGQEELYEAAEKVLMELKAMTEYAQPFLTRVNKRDVPDYHNIITKPMDIGFMIKKLKQLGYKSKKEFVDDLNLIWSNCLKYNMDPAHPFRKKALYMRKETDKLTPLIPEIVVRDRAEVEAEERRQHAADADDSDEDDAPIMASRGRKAPKKGGPTSARKGTNGGPSVNIEDGETTPAPDAKPTALMHHQPSHLRNDLLRADSEIPDASSAGFNTPPPGSATPMPNGIHGSGAPGSQADHMEVDGPSVISAATEDADEDDTEFKTWKQVTKKDRAMAAADRNRLFRGEHLNLEEPALLRNKAKMRRWIRQQKMLSEKPSIDADPNADDSAAEVETGGETLAEGIADGIEKDEDSTLPDYYDPLSAIPELDSKWKWMTDNEGYAVPQTDEWMRMYPKQGYKAIQGGLNQRLEANIRQMQETRKICSKIGIVKQMQIQAQTYQNQFQKYDPEPFMERDPGAVVVSEDGPLMAPWVNRAAFQKCVGKIFYHAGFEDFQPSALEAVTDLAVEFMQRVGQTLKLYGEQPKQTPEGSAFTLEEQVLHTLDENGQDIDSMETYIRDEVERQTTKLGVMHERMKSHLADLLRPALGDHAGADGVGAFNDGSEQFVGGDFAEDLDEDFFGFRELGLADEFGLESLSVPLHLLQNRMHSQYQAANAGPVISNGLIFETPEPYHAITIDNIPHHVALVQDFFRAKLRNNHDEPLIEDEELPQKQRFPKPRLPPTGKITSPRKRPLKEQAQAAKKKRKLEQSGVGEKEDRPLKPLRLQVPESESLENGVDPEKGSADDANNGMLSPAASEAN